MYNNDIPLVSVITPSYNQAKFIQETIESVLEQEYSRVEHIVVDGGSTDGTLEILQRYSNLLGDRFRFVSEPDRGQSHAINKGIKMAKGEIIGWLNSDDTYLPEAVCTAVDSLNKNPEWGMVYGNAYFTDENNNPTQPYPVKEFSKEGLFEYCIICQPAAFIVKKVFDTEVGVDESLQFCMDYDLWMRISKKYPIGYVNKFLANSRLHPSSKTVMHAVDYGLPEIFKTSIKNYGTVSNYWLNGFIGEHYRKGASWIMEQLKSYSIFGHTPQIGEMNRYHDSWVPPHFGISILVDPQFPLNSILIKGRHLFPEIFEKKKFSVSVYVNNKFSETVTLSSKKNFMLEIPVKSNLSHTVVELVSHDSFIPLNKGINEDDRVLSFIVDHVIPLSSEEHTFYQMFSKGLGVVIGWINQTRDPLKIAHL